MSNYTMKMQNDNLSNIAALSVMARTSNCYKDTFEASARFFLSAAQLPKGEFLGWQISADKEARCPGFVFSSAKANVAAEDFNWIFQEYATVEKDSSQLPAELTGENRKVYALRPRPAGWGDGEQDVYIDTAFREISNDLLGMLADSGAIIRILSESDGISDVGRGEILFSFPEEVSLRMRTALAQEFPHTIVQELNGEDTPQETSGQLPITVYPARHMAVFLQTLAPKAEPEDSFFMLPECDFDDELPFGPCEEDLYDLDEEASLCDMEDLEEEVPLCDLEEDEKESKDWDSVPLDDLELSVRAYNCLRRAGIDSVGELRRLSDADLRNIQNLNRKNVEEIREKLAKAQGLPVPAPNYYSAMLDEMIGLKDVKEQIGKITAFARMKRDLAARKEKTASVVLNMEFVGNPGTAKTTVARIVAGILHEAGLLSDAKVVEVGRADLVAKYVGQTADKVKSVFQQAKGKLLFIDEAYSLLENWEGEFGDEAINTIVQEMENHREDTVVIFAGYPDKMKGFFARNPGLRSRVPYKITFQDYSAEEMVQIAELEAKKRGFTIQPQAKEKVAAICKTATGNPDAGNGRFCRNLVESAVLGYASRVYGGSSESGNETDGKDFALTEEDFTVPGVLQKAKKPMSMGFRI